MAAHYGLTPTQTGDLSLREAAVMIVAAHDREKMRWRHTAMIVTGMINYAGMRGQGFRPKPLDWLYNEMFGAPTRKAMSPDAIRAALSSVATRKGPRIDPALYKRGDTDGG